MKAGMLAALKPEGPYTHGTNDCNGELMTEY